MMEMQTALQNIFQFSLASDLKFPREYGQARNINQRNKKKSRTWGLVNKSMNIKKQGCYDYAFYWYKLLVKP